MYLPEKLQEMNYSTWNHTVKGLMRVWEIANKLGLDRYLNERLRSDEGCALAERVAEIGNDPVGWLASTMTASKRCVKRK